MILAYIPIVIPPVAHSSEGADIDNMSILYVALVSMLAVYYLCVMCGLSIGDFKTKKEFIKALIPFQMLYDVIVSSWKKLE